MCHLLFGMIHALSRPIHSQRHHLFCIIPQAPPVFHLVQRRISQNVRRTESAQHSRAWSTHQKAADCLFQQSAVFWAMSSHLCSQYHSIIAVYKMLLTAIWNILSKLVPYTPVGFLATPHVAAPSRTLTISQGLSLLRHRGYYILVDDSALPVP